jgi:uncharacterized protein with PQ loop repeat
MSMPLDEITLVLFAVCNSVRVIAYVPQIIKAATDKNGATSISSMTWFLFLLAHLSTVAYALINKSDWGLATCFAFNAVCCATIVVTVYWKRCTYRKGLRQRDPPVLCREVQGRVKLWGALFGNRTAL